MTNEPVEIEKIEIENTNADKAAKPQKVKKPKNPVIQNDIMRYKKNKLGANLALLGLALGCVYFLCLYSQVKNNNFYYTWVIAFDVIYNLFFLLFVFLFSEQVKNYNRKLFVLQIIVGALQIARLFWLPLTGLLGEAIDIGAFLTMAISLAASGALIIASAIIGYVRSKGVENFTKQLEEGLVDLDGELKKQDDEVSEEVANVEVTGGEVNA